MLAQLEKINADNAKTKLEMNRLQQDLRLEPWKLILTTVVGTITALGAWSAFLVFLLNHWGAPLR